MRYKRLLILIIFTCLLAISTVSAADNVTGDIVSVHNQDNDIIGEVDGNANPKTFTDLNNIINGNNKTDIYLNCNYTFDPNVDADFKEGINISRAVTIWGNGYTLNGNNAARIFSPNNDDIVLHGIVFINGKTVGGGGAIGGECTSINCTFINNSAVGSGGAVWRGYCVNCTFINNSAAYDGGAVYGASCVNCSFTENSAGNQGGALTLNSESIVNCIFMRNSAYRGGAIYYNSYGNSIIENCTFIENSANIGGAIDSYEGNAIVNCNFTRNSAVWEAGAVFYASCVNCSFTENYADRGGAMKYSTANNCIFTGNYAISGGALYASESVNCVFNENYADYGGAIYASFGTENCSFTENFADFGGAMYGGDLEYSTNYAVNCRFINNTARNGGATYQVKVENCYFKDNEATENGGAMYGESATNCIFQDNGAKGYGNDTYNTVIPDSLYDNNIIYFDASAQQDGNGSKNSPYKYLYPDRITSGVIAYFADGTYDLNSTCIIDGAKLIANGDAVIINSKVSNQYDFIINENSYLELDNLFLININILNHATLMARNVYFEGNDVFDPKNLPEIESGSGLFDSSYGGVIVCDTPNNVRSTLILDGCNFEKIYDAFNGGVIAAINSDISITFSWFKHYSATYKGGAIYCVNSNVNIHDSRFDSYTNYSDEDSTIDRYNDYTSYYGGSIYCENCDMYIDSSKFDGSISFSFGGCIASLNSRISIEMSEFNNSVSLTDGGGAIYNSKGELCIFDSTFDGNGAEFGGAICNINSILDSYYSLYNKNFANCYGGVIYDIYGTLGFYSNRFFTSRALVGGSIYARIPNSFNLYFNYLEDSVAQEGSAIFFDGKKEIIGSNDNFIDNLNPDGFEIFNEISDNSFDNTYHIFVEFKATLNGEDYYLISNPLYYHLSSETSWNLVQYGPIFEVNDGLVSMMIYDRDDGSNLSTITSSDVVRNVSVKISFSEEFINPTLNFYLFKYTNSLLFDEREYGTNVYSGSMEEIYEFPFIGMYSINISDRVINNNYNITESYAIDFGELIVSIKSDNLYEASSYYPVSLVNNSFADSYSIPSNLDALPSYYNSNDYGFVSSVKDQKNGGNCWAFAGLATLETCLKKATGVSYDFSEENAKNLMAAYSVYGVKIETNYAGYDSMIMSYLTSWLGPIDESTENYDDYSSISVLENPMFHIQNIKFLPARLDSSDNDLYKMAIMDYGAVSVIFKWDKDYHAVSLVGWDDNYKGYDSLGNKANGAWIFKNSFGEDWENNGFGYLSYNQKISEQIDPSLHAYTFIFNDANPYSKIYQYDFAGISQFYHYLGSIYFKNTFVAEDDSLLSAFSTYFDAQTNYTVSVYVNDQFVFAQNGTASAGYYTIPFNTFIQLDKGDKFTIAVHNHNREGYSCIPLCYAEDITKKTFSENVSFVSLDGETWYDLYDYADSCHVACIKAFTQNINLKSIKINANEIQSVNTHNFNVKVSFDDFENISSINYCLLKFTVDGKDYYAQIKDGVACLNLKLEDGIHSLSTQYKDNVFESNVIQFNFTVDATQESFSFNAIQDMVDSASDKSTISLDNDYSYDEYLDDGDYGIHIDKAITINGNGHVLDGLNKATAFYIASDNVVLNDIVFVNTYSLNGGGIFVAGRNVTLNNCIFINSSANQSGGAIYSLFDINLNNCQFINDSANMGGGLYLISTETSHIQNSCFVNNTAALHGSAIYMLGVGDVLISSTNFTSNTASYNGGAVFSSVYLNNFTDCNFADNHANSGGAIFSNARINEFANCNFTDNRAKKSGGAINAHNKINVYNSNFINNSVTEKNPTIFNSFGDYGGGAITSYDDLNIYNSNFINNHAFSSGGALYTNEFLNVYRSNFINNSALNNGGAIYNNPRQMVTSDMSTYKFTESHFYDSTFIGNHANDGGAIYHSDLVVNCTFIDNSASHVSGAIVYAKVVKDSLFINNSAEYCGVIYTNGLASLYVYNSVFINNRAEINAGVIFGDEFWDDDNNYYSSNIHIFNGTFINNSAVSNGGVIYSIGNMSVYSSSFINNSAEGGGAIVSFGDMHVYSSNFTGNSALDTAGAIYSGMEGFIVNSCFVNNSARKNGGAMCYCSAVNCIFICNSAARGGATYYGSADSCIFKDNTATLGKDTFRTNMLKPILSVSDFISTYKSGDKLIVNFTNSNGIPIDNANVTISVYKNDALVGIYYCLSGDGWIVDLEAGDYVAVVSVNPGYLIASVDVTLTINKVKTSITSQKTVMINVGEDANLVATLTNEDTGKAISNANIVFNINDVKYSVKTNASGQAKLTVPGLASGTYNVTVTYKGNSKYYSSNTTANIVVNKITTSVSIYYDDSANELVATLINSKTGKGISGANVVFNLNGVKTAVKTDKQGQARLFIGDVDLKNFNAGISYGGNAKYLKSTGSIKIAEGKMPTVISNAYNKETSEVIATLTNAETGNAIKGATVVFNINGVKTALKTDKLGQVKLSVAGLDLGVNSIGSSYGGNSKYSGSTTSIIMVNI